MITTTIHKSRSEKFIWALGSGELMKKMEKGQFRKVNQSTWNKSKLFWPYLEKNSQGNALYWSIWSHDWGLHQLVVLCVEQQAPAGHYNAIDHDGYKGHKEEDKRPVIQATYVIVGPDAVVIKSVNTVVTNTCSLQMSVIISKFNLPVSLLLQKKS